jgi:hypothetical protein
VTGDAGQRVFAGRVALAGGEADGGETDAGRVFDFRLRRGVFAVRRAVAFGAEGDVFCALDRGFARVIVALAMAALAVDAGLGFAGGMAVETLKQPQVVKTASFTSVVNK